MKVQDTKMQNTETQGTEMQNAKIQLHGKKDFQQLMLRLLEPLKPHYSEGRARLDLGVTMAHYDQNATWMEAFSRPLWGLVPFWAGGGTDKEFEEIYRRGLTAGTNAENAEYWGECSDFDQRFVEMAAISYGILFAPEIVWNPLTDAEKENLAGYLLKINEHPLPVCNWILFAVLVNIAMKSVGKAYSQEMLENYLRGLETFYLGDGWYQDGDSGQKDYYISFAIHFYCLVYARTMEQEDPERAALYKERARTFGQQFIYWFDETGEALPFGRSLTYRFSQVSFFSACLLADVYPFSLEIMKGLIVRHLQNWMEKPIFDRDGILTIGYGYPNLIMAERYNAPGSPYWSMKTFAFLVLPDEHPFWKAEAAAYPASLIGTACAMPSADMLMWHYGTHTTAYTPGVYSPNGHGQIVAKYGKFAYDTRFSINMAKSCYELHENAPDSMLAFVVDGYIYVRRICEARKLTEKSVWSRWSPYPGIEVETTITPNENGHSRMHKIKSRISCIAYDCGFAVNRGSAEPVEFQSAVGENSAEAMNCYSSCKVIADEDPGEGELILADPNLNLLYPKVAIPAVKYQIAKGKQTLQTTIQITVK